MTISVKVLPNSGHHLRTDKFFKTRGCPLFGGFTVLKINNDIVVEDLIQFFGSNIVLNI